MAKRITKEEAVTRFSPYLVSNINAGDIIQEAVYRIYDMGRWHGTTTEVALSDSDFEEIDQEHYLFFNEVTYNGMIGFRNESVGWPIMDQTILYRDGVNGGDGAIIDMGTVDKDGVDHRKYRMPHAFTTDGGPYMALIKLEAPELADDTLIPFHSIGALKAAIMACSYESVGDDARAMQHWQKFNQLMTLSERQVEGPKKYYIGMKSSLRRKPKQFM